MAFQLHERIGRGGLGGPAGRGCGTDRAAILDALAHCRGQADGRRAPGRAPGGARLDHADLETQVRIADAEDVAELELFLRGYLLAIDESALAAFHVLDQSSAVLEV